MLLKIWQGSLHSQSEPGVSKSTIKIIRSYLVKSLFYKKIFKYAYNGKGKGKEIPLQAGCGPEGEYCYSSTLP